MKRKDRGLSEAVLSGNLISVLEQLAQGADPNVSDREHRTPLFSSVIDDNISISRELIRHGAEVNVRDKRGETPLHFAAREHNIASARLLLQHGAEVDARDMNGNTPLSHAVFESRGRGEMISLLLSYGANKFLPNNYGISPKDLADSIANYRISQYLDDKV